MAQKITLSIPDMLHEKLDEWRSSFNLSKMFQETVAEAIHKKEELQKRFSEEFDMPEIVQRLRQEKRDWEQQLYEAGKTQGLHWARSAHYLDLLHVLHTQDHTQLPGQDKFKPYFKGMYKKYAITTYPDPMARSPKQKFLDGWIKGVNAFWNEVKEQI